MFDIYIAMLCKHVSIKVLHYTHGKVGCLSLANLLVLPIREMWITLIRYRKNFFEVAIQPRTDALFQGDHVSQCLNKKLML